MIDRALRHAPKLFSGRNEGSPTSDRVRHTVLYLFATTGPTKHGGLRTVAEVCASPLVSYMPSDLSHPGILHSLPLVALRAR